MIILDRLIKPSKKKNGYAKLANILMHYENIWRVVQEDLREFYWGNVDKYIYISY